MTVSEVVLWSHLSRGKFGASFRKQHPIGPYFLDFYCPSLKLAIELDGSQHKNQSAYDARRTSFLESKGIIVLRFWNNEVLQAIDSVGRVISDAMLARRLELEID